MNFGDWQYLDWKNVPGALDWLGFLLGGIGLLIALVQLFKSKGALIAAKESLDRARTDLLSNRLGVAIPRLQEVIQLLGSAIDENNRDATSVYLAESARQIAEVRTLLELNGEEHRELVDDMEKFYGQLPLLALNMQEKKKATLVVSIGRAMVPLRELVTSLEVISVKSQHKVELPAAAKKKNKGSK